MEGIQFANRLPFGDEGAMRILNRGMVTAWLLAACCWIPASVRAADGEVRDPASLFSASAVKQAEETIRNIRKEFRKDLLVETFAGVPDGKTADYTRNREEFFTSLVNERAKSARVDGIYVLVMKEPPPHRFRIQVGVGQATRQQAFLSADRDGLVRVFQSSFRDDKFDEGLLAAVGFVERTLRSNLQGGANPRLATQGAANRQPSPAGASSSFSFGSLLMIGLLIVGGFMLIRFLMRLIRGGAGGGRGGLAGAGGMPGMGGGGFLPGLLGGIGGAIAGSWLYNQFAGSNAHAADHSTQNPSDAPASDVGGDYSSSGGDVDSGGGGDFDGGGGDFGGGGDV